MEEVQEKKAKFDFEKYGKFILAAVIATATLVGNYYVLHYRVNELTEDVKANQEMLTGLVIDTEVIKSKLE